METMTDKSSLDFIENFIHSFEDQIEKIESVFRSSEAVSDSSHLLFNDFRQSLSKLRDERNRLNERLRENLARNGSLRRNDYDCMMEEIFTLLDEKEKDAENQFYRYIDDQKAMARFLRQGILEIKDIDQEDNREKIREFRSELETILQAQQHRKELAIKTFLEFQNTHQRITVHFHKLLDEDAHLLCKDIKNVKKHILEELDQRY
jgi:alpha-mannosidase